MAAAARKVIGIDVGGTKMLAGVVDKELETYHRTERNMLDLGQGEIVDTIADAVNEARDAEPDVEAVGFGIPCLIDRRSGVAVIAVNLPIADMPFRDIMRERLGLPVFIDNDATVATLAEQRFGAARGADNVVGLTIGTGIGGGLVLDGRLYHGHVGAAAELGHMVIDEDGPPCQGQCPNNGCLEAVASGVAIAREGALAAQQEPESALGSAVADGIEITGELVTDLALDGDEVARMVLGQIGRKLGVGFSNIVNIFDPEVIVVGGGAMKAGDLLLDPAREELRRRALPPGRDLVRIVPAQFGAEAGMLGAALLAIDELRDSAASGAKARRTS
jgi:glucokinase